jgi:hypothetical protein
MENSFNGNIAFSKNVVEFVTVGVQFCSFLENTENITRSEMTDKLSKLLPLLYLKASLLPGVEAEGDVYTEVTVTEDDYNYIASKLLAIYKSDDVYLEVFEEDMKFSDTPISASISENIADIYQDIKNFVAVYEQGLEESIDEAVFACRENFATYWGQKLVNVLRALHYLKYSANGDLPEFDEDLTNTDDEW